MSSLIIIADALHGTDECLVELKHRLVVYAAVSGDTQFMCGVKPCSDFDVTFRQCLSW